MIAKFKAEMQNIASTPTTPIATPPTPTSPIKRAIASITKSPSESQLEPSSKKLELPPLAPSTPSLPQKKKQPWFADPISMDTDEMDIPLHNPYMFKIKTPEKPILKAADIWRLATNNESLVDDLFIVTGYIDQDTCVSVQVSRRNTLLKEIVWLLEGEVGRLVDQRVKVVMIRTRDKDEEWVDIVVGSEDPEVEEVDWRIRVSECWENRISLNLVVERRV
ncbi:UNVERIFIED_CONTAM: hypothetical protein HDU68_008912 [Siphonaria sp. JEL0065]|nr:hypothetical protein HDU68_008912 [Siphonaria sp. JEL0065]